MSIASPGVIDRARSDRLAQPAVSVAPPPKLRRRPVFAVASVAAICLGALVAAWAWTATSTSTDVVAVRASVARGEVIERGDLLVVQVGVDPALRPLPGEALDTVVGRRAAMDLAAGGLVTADAVTDTVVPSRGMSVVGVSLPPSLLPGEELRAGDRVRVVATPGVQGDVIEGEQRFIEAVVVGVYPDAEAGQTVVSVEVPYVDAAELAARAATGRVVLVLDSRER